MSDPRINAPRINDPPTSDPLPKPPPLWARKVRELFGIDLRSLALFRIGLGLVILGDLLDRATALRAHYTDQGVLPRDTLTRFFPREASFSLHLIGGSTFVEAMLFILAGVFAVMLTVGFRTRLATVVSWVLLLSVDNRNPMIVQSGDVLLRVLVFWSIFLPLGAVWSVDRRKRSSPHYPPPAIRRSPFLSLATAALLLQVCFVYWFGYLLKAGPIWHEGQALYYALNCDLYVARAGVWLNGHPSWLVPLTLAVLYTELIGPFFAFCPVFTGPVRMATVVVFVILHVCFGTFLSIGLFPYVSVLAWLVFIPGWFWERAWVRRWTRTPPPEYPEAGANGPIGRRERRRFFARVAGSALVLTAFYFVAVWNLRQNNVDELDPPPPTAFRLIGDRLPLPDVLSGAGVAMGIDQCWTMFAPSPPAANGWFVVVGRLANGRDAEMLRPDGVVTWDKPQLVSATISNGRWQKYFENLSSHKFQAHLRFYSQYLCRRWNRGHAEDEAVRSIQIYWMVKYTLKDHVTEPERKLLSFHICTDQTTPGTHAIEQ